MFLHPLFHRQDLVPQFSQLIQLLLNLLQAFMSLTVGNLGVGQIPASQSILLVQFLTPAISIGAGLSCRGELRDDPCH